MKTRWLLPVVAATFACACSGKTAPRPQWKVYLGTDAPVPQLGQQVLVELIDASGNPVSSSLRRLIDGSSAALWPISFGVEPSDASSAPPRIRVRFYRIDETGPDGSPAGGMLVDATATLPALGDAVTSTGLTLAMACFGVAADVANQRTCNPATGQLDAEPTLPSGFDPSTLPAVGSWGPAAAVPCSSQPPAGMACAPGGVFILGSTQYFRGFANPVPEHLVQLSPFAIDLDEVSVGDIQPLVKAGTLAPPGTGDPAGYTPPMCTYLSASDTTHAGYPVNCVPWTWADEACKALGKRLPTEAEWEYVAGGLGAKLPYPWGADPAICNYAVVSSGRSFVPQPEPYECLTGSEAPGPHPRGGTVNDVVDSEVPGIGGQVLNLGGNVDEWVADVFDAYSGPCWQTGASLLVDPQCTASVAGASKHVTRGGAWQLQALSASTHARDASIDDGPAVATGFRCAMSM